MHNKHDELNEDFENAGDTGNMIFFMETNWQKPHDFWLQQQFSSPRCTLIVFQVGESCKPVSSLGP